MRRKRRLPQFTLSTILFASCCLAGYLTGLRQGFYATRDELRQYSHYTHLYAVSDLVVVPGNHDDPDSLLDLIETTVSPLTWQEPDNSLAYFADAQTLCVRQTGLVHDEVAALLDRLRSLKQRYPSISADSTQHGPNGETLR